MTTTASTPRHLVQLEALSAAEIVSILDRADALLPIVRGDAPPIDSLSGKIIAHLFFEDSTRTRSSFAIAARRLGGETIDLVRATSSISKGETVLDSVRNIEAMGVAAIVIRTTAAGVPVQIAPQVEVPIINAGDGRHEHPTQGLLDLMTMRQHFVNASGGERVFEGSRLAIVGDVVNSRVARSAIHGFTTLGGEVTLVGSSALAPETFERVAAGPGRVTIGHDFDEVIDRSDLDGLMMLRVQFERNAAGAVGSVEEYRERFALTEDRASRLPERVIVMHPGPMNRGLEIESRVADDPARSVIFAQVTNGVAVRMAVLERAIFG